MTPEDEDLWFLPLGGCGEIGMNLNLYGHAGRWLMVDCGITFGRDGEPGPRVQMPDPTFIAARSAALAGLVITHAHEDHVGAVAHLWTRFRCPIHTTRFTAELLRRKLFEAGLADVVPITIVTPGQTRSIGPFDVTWISLTHSTPESQALAIGTPAGTIFHTGDWKLDRDPVVGPAFDRDCYAALADAPVRAMVCDSTNALTPGRSPSEGSLFADLRAASAAAPGRIVIACFGSNVARLRTLARVAAATGRHAGLLGRSLRNYFGAARRAGVWEDDDRLIDASHLGYLPPREVLAIATGSQGEPRAALDRLAADSHPDLSLQPGDTVLFSSRVIPGNEAAVATLIARFHALGVEVIQDGDGGRLLHASGHPARDELAAMYRWVQPQIAIPVHGEPPHLRAHAQLARQLGVPRQLEGRNGDLFMLAPAAGIRRGAAPVGRLGLDRRGLAPIPARPASTAAS